MTADDESAWQILLFYTSTAVVYILYSSIRYHLWPWLRSKLCCSEICHYGCPMCDEGLKPPKAIVIKRK